jgi:hypothetical protein
MSCHRKTDRFYFLFFQFLAMYVMRDILRLAPFLALYFFAFDSNEFGTS